MTELQLGTLSQWTLVADLGGALGAEAPTPLKCISPWPIAYAATLRNKSNVYPLFGDTNLAQQTGYPTQQCFKRFISILCTSILFNASQCLINYQ